MPHSIAVQKQLLRDLHAANDTGNAAAVSETMSTVQFAYDSGELSAEAYAALRSEAVGMGHNVPAP